MRGRTLHVLAAAAALGLGGCVVLDIIALPVKLLIGLFSGIGTAVSGLVSVADVDPASGPPPAVVQIAPHRWAVEGLRPEQSCTITCTAEGCVPRVFAWPGDFLRSGEDVTVVFDGSK